MASFARPTAGRAVHLRISPRPSNISESREILRLVSQFGEVEYFKNLKYDTLSAPSTALVIFREATSAESCLKREPIRFRLGPDEADVEERSHMPTSSLDNDPPGSTSKPAPARSAQPSQQQTPPHSPKSPLSAPFGMSQTRSLSTNSLPNPPRTPPTLPFLQPQPQPQSQSYQNNHPTSRIFQLSINPARVNFRDHIDRSRRHNTFSIDTGTAIQQDLAKRVPLPGLSCWDWRKPEMPERHIQKSRKAERERKTLMQVWEEGRLPGEA